MKTLIKIIKIKIFAKKDSFLEILKPKTDILTPFLEKISSRISKLRKFFYSQVFVFEIEKNERTSMVKIGFKQLVIREVMVFVIRDFSLKDTVEIVRYQSMSLFQMKRDKSNLTSFSEVSLFEFFVHFLFEIF